ncbi:MAG: hypothetical protein M0D55_09605 [Elusimicrobiota bacterium]|nr:MAG: hypothetical protein M0D55_09605 [Elusimicrobiota bacterium]
MPDDKSSPGGIITSYAFKYAIQFFQFAEPKYPEMKKQPIDARLAAYQAAILVWVLILEERRTPGVSKELHANVSRAFPPSARRRCLTAVQDLAAFLLKMDRGSIGPDEIPAVVKLAGNADSYISDAMGVWLGGTVMDKWTLGEADKPAAAAMARSSRTSAIMIGRMLAKAK